MNPRFVAVVFALTFAPLLPARAQLPGAPAPRALPAETILVALPGASITKQDFDNEMLKLPAELRPGFVNNPRRIDDLLQRMATQRMLAGQARALKIDQDPEVAARLAMEVERYLAQVRIAKYEAEAAAEFDARRVQWEARAREIYLADRKKFELPEQVSASHILFDLKKHSSDDGKKLALAAHERVRAGADFNVVAKEVSEDPTAPLNAGKLDFFTRSEMDPAFTEAAFALRQVGDVSIPVLSQFGWHLIRLDGRKPAGQRSFDEVKESIVGELRQKYVNDKRDALLAALRGDPQLKYNREAIDALAIRPDVEAAKRALSAPSAVPLGSSPPK
jgi:peptidyl-prolyl cis-trans isomerase C